MSTTNKPVRPTGFYLVELDGELIDVCWASKGWPFPGGDPVMIRRHSGATATVSIFDKLASGKGEWREALPFRAIDPNSKLAQMLASLGGELPDMLSGEMFVVDSVPQPKQSKLEQIQSKLDSLTDEERLELFGRYCRGCGCINVRNEHGQLCHCQNDE